VARLAGREERSKRRRCLGVERDASPPMVGFGLRGPQRFLSLDQCLHDGSRPASRSTVASRVEALSIFTGLAREGRTSAAIALVRELRPNDEASIDDALDRILG
jgi:hypothetical protein